MVRFLAQYDEDADTLTVSRVVVPVDTRKVTTPGEIQVTVDQDATQVYRVEIPNFLERVGFVEIYLLFGPDGVRQIARLQDDLTFGTAELDMPDAPLRPRSSGRKLLLSA